MAQPAAPTPAASTSANASAVASDAAEPTPAKKSKKKLFIIVGVVAVLLAGGGGAWFFIQSGEATQEAKAEPTKAPIFMPLEPFIVNLQGGEQYLQTDITLQLEDEAQLETIKLHMPRVRSRLLTLLSSMDAERLAKEEDKNKLAQAIRAQVQRPFDNNGKPQKVKDVLFTSFVIQ